MALWSQPKGVFLRAGMANILVALFFLAVIDGIASRWTLVSDLDPLLMAFFLGIVGGLFFELWRFFVLDKVFKKVRSLREGVFFAIGWNGVLTFFIGLLLFFGSLATYSFISADDPSVLLPVEDEETLKLFNEQVSLLTNASPGVSLIPLFERLSLLLVDIVLTLIMLQYFVTANTGFVWRAVGLRACFTAGGLLLQTYSSYGALAFYVLVGILSFSFINKAYQNA